MHVITSLNRGGAETMLSGLVRENPEDDDQVVVSLLQDCDLTADMRAAGVRVHELGISTNPIKAARLLRLANLIRRERPDVIQGWMYHGDLAALVALYLSGLRREIALCWGIRCSDMDLGRYNWTLRLVVRLCVWLSRLPDVVIANSEAGRSAHAALGYRPPRFEVVHNGIDVARFHPDRTARAALRREFGIPEDARVLAQLARVDPMKNHAGMLAAMAKVPGLWLVLIGKDSEKLPRQDRVVALGMRDDIERLLPMADGIVSSSLFGEGLSNALAEGMACGLMPIATDVGDSRLLVAETGVVVPSNDSAALISALESFAAMTDKAISDAGSASRAVVTAKFGLAAAARNFRKIHASVWKRKAAKD